MNNAEYLIFILNNAEHLIFILNNAEHLIFISQKSNFQKKITKNLIPSNYA